MYDGFEEDAASLSVAAAVGVEGNAKGDAHGLGGVIVSAGGEVPATEELPVGFIAGWIVGWLKGGVLRISDAFLLMYSSISYCWKNYMKTACTVWSL